MIFYFELIKKYSQWWARLVEYRTISRLEAARKLKFSTFNTL